MLPNKVESGVQLFSRINRRTHLEGINSTLFPEGGPYPNQVIEIVGSPETDKTNLALDLLVRCILPARYNNEWKECGAIFICTDYQITMFKIIRVIDKHLQRLNVQSRKDVIESSLYNLTILHCYNQDQLEITFNNLERIIQRNENISLVMIDNIASQYWATRSTAKSNLSLYSHALENFELLYGHLKNLNTVLVFVRNENVLQKRQLSTKVDYRIEVQCVDDNENYKAVVTNYEKKSENCGLFNLETIVNFQC